MRGTDGFKFFEVAELEGLLQDAGFADVKARKQVFYTTYVRGQN